MKRVLEIFVAGLVLAGCSAFSKEDGEKMTVDSVDVQKFMGKWYVLGGRFTALEKEVHNGTESYTWNEKKKRIDIDFRYNKGSFNGKVKSYPQKGWLYNTKTNAHWKVQPIWPLKLNYLIVGLAPDYSWTAIGVPNQKYLWIMARSPENADKKIAAAKARLKKIGYDGNIETTVPHDSPKH